MSTLITRPGSILTIALAFIATGAIILASVTAMSGYDNDPPTRDALRAALLRVGLGPEPLAAAGLTTGQVRAVVAGARSHLTDHGGALDAADSAYTSAKGTHDTLRRLVVAGKASQNDLASFNSNKSTLATAASRRSAALDALFTAATDDLTQAQVATISAIAANDWSIPIRYRTASRTQADRVALRDALANDRISTKLGEDPDSASQQLLLAANATHAVATATANLNARLAANTATWEQETDE